MFEHRKRSVSEILFVSTLHMDAFQSRDGILLSARENILWDPLPSSQDVHNKVSFHTSDNLPAHNKRLQIVI